MDLVPCEFCDATTVASEPCCSLRFKTMVVRSLRAENAALRDRVAVLERVREAAALVAERKKGKEVSDG